MELSNCLHKDKGIMGALEAPLKETEVERKEISPGATPSPSWSPNDNSSIEKHPAALQGLHSQSPSVCTRSASAAPRAGLLARRASKAGREPQSWQQQDERHRRRTCWSIWRGRIRDCFSLRVTRVSKVSSALPHPKAKEGTIPRMHQLPSSCYQHLPLL